MICRPFTFGGTGDGLPDGIMKYLEGRDIVVLADNDSGGKAHAERKASLAHSIARSVKVVHFPELPPKADVSDFLQCATAADLKKRVIETTLWEPQPTGTQAGARR